MSRCILYLYSVLRSSFWDPTFEMGQNFRLVAPRAKMSLPWGGKLAGVFFEPSLFGRRISRLFPRPPEFPQHSPEETIVPPEWPPTTRSRRSQWTVGDHKCEATKSVARCGRRWNFPREIVPVYKQWFPYCTFRMN